MIWEPEEEKTSEINFKNALIFSAIFIGFEILFAIVTFLSPTPGWLPFLVSSVIGLLLSILVSMIFICD